MVGYSEYTKGYNIFDPSTQSTFIERSLHFEEEIIQDFETALGECSSPQHQDDVSDDSLYDNYDFEMVEYDFFEHESPTWPKWVENTLEADGDLASNPLDPRKTRPQFHTACFSSEVYLGDK